MLQFTLTQEAVLLAGQKARFAIGRDDGKVRPRLAFITAAAILGEGRAHPANGLGRRNQLQMAHQSDAGNLRDTALSARPQGAQRSPMTAPNAGPPHPNPPPPPPE